MALPEKRWIQRFDNYTTVLQHLENFVAIEEERPLSLAEEFAILKVFELVFETAWNLLKDYLIEQGYVQMHGSRDAIRSAFRVGIIDNGEIWFDMIKNRNTTAHAYDEETAQEVTFVVSNEYMEEFRKLKAKFEKFKQEQE
ncbi:MAG: nucleotidyltransferase substrate binding protein [Chitinispirillia bacterium]|nr:nucleotidyltransferase substrate binding protein [Chitinispirillia bacterium]